MKTNEKREGIWLSKELMENKDLDWTNKVLLADICSLHELPKGCFGSNEYFGNLLGVTSGAASKRISHLTSLGYIKTENKFEKRQCIGRIIIPTMKKYSYKLTENKETKVVPEQPCSTSSKNHGMITEQPVGSSKSNSEMVPERPEGCSETTMEVVPKQPEGSSSENITNTYINKETEKQLKENEEIKEQIPEQDTRAKSDLPQVEILPVKKNSELLEARIAMNEWFYDYPNWENDLYKLGIDKFINKTATKYRTSDRQSIDIIKYFLSL